MSATAPTAPDAAELVVSGLSAGYGPVTVLHGIDLRCRAGRTLGVTGPNGAGKSTLLKTLAGALPVARGTISLAGREITGRAAHLRVRDGLALVPEGRQVIGGLSVAHNLDITVMARNRWRLDAEHRRRRDAVYELFPRLRERAEVSASSLSGGEQQMLAIARALMTGPRVLLLDEPSQGLSLNVVELVIGALGRLRGTMTIVIVEQNAALLGDLVDDTVRMRFGRLSDD